MVGGIGTRSIATRWPIVKGLVAGTTSQTGNKESLEPEINAKDILKGMNTMINVPGDHLQLTNIGTNTHAQIDTAIANSVAHIADNTQAHSDYLKNDAVDEGVGLTLTGDNSSADTAYVPMVLYNTDATPPAASGFPIGTIYIQYTP